MRINKMYIIVGVVIVVALFLYTSIDSEDEVPEKVDDKGVDLVVYGWRDGVKIGIISTAKKDVFSIVEFDPPGDPVSDIDAISIRHTISSQRRFTNVDVEISDLQATFSTDRNGDLPNGDDRYESAISGLPQSFILTPGASQRGESDPFDITDLEDDCNDFPYCEIKLQAVVSFQDVDPNTGLEITTNIPLEESFGTVTTKISSEGCRDGTPSGQCSLSSPGGKFCIGDRLIDCADPTGCTTENYGVISCACDSGYYETDGDAVCSAPICDGGLSAGLCVGEDSLICDPNCTSETCGTIQDCYECGRRKQRQGSPLGWFNPSLNSYNCPDAYNGDRSYACSIDEHICKYRGKKGKVNIIIGGS